MTVRTEYRQAKYATTRRQAASVPMAERRETAAQGRFSGNREGRTANDSTEE